MRILCVSQNLPAETDPVALALAAIPGNEVLSATQQKHAAKHPAIARMFLRKCDSAKFEKNYLGFVSGALRTARYACSAFSAAANGGFIPDMILSCSSNGAGFALRQAFPEAFIVCFSDSKLGILRPRGRDLFEARLAVQQKQFCESDLAFIDFPGQAEDLRCCQALAFPPSVDTVFYRPEDGAAPCVTIMAGALETKALAGTWNFCLSLLRKKTDIRIRILAENSLKDLRWREIQEGRGEESPRIRAEYRPSQESWLAMLRESSAVLCLAADVAIARRLLEAMSCEKTIIVAENSLPFVKPGENCLQLPKAKQADFVLDVAARAPHLSPVGKLARQTVLAGFDQSIALPKLLDRIRSEYGKQCQG